MADYEPMTDAELNKRIELFRCGTNYSVAREIGDELLRQRADNAKLCRWKVRYGRRIKSLEAENAKLRESLKHSKQNRGAAKLEIEQRILADNAKLLTELEIARSGQAALTSRLNYEIGRHDLTLTANKFSEDRIGFLEIELARVRKAMAVLKGTDHE